MGGDTNRALRNCGSANAAGGKTVRHCPPHCRLSLPTDCVAGRSWPVVTAHHGDDQAGQVDAILDELRSVLQESPFHFGNPAEDVKILDGKMEGVYGWTTINTLLGTLGASNSQGSGGTPTSGIIDLGGGSTQIVFEPVSMGAADRSDTHLLAMDGGEHLLFAHSYLGWGLNAGGKLITDNCADPHAVGGAKHPCFAPGSAVHVQVRPSLRHARLRYLSGSAGA